MTCSSIDPAIDPAGSLDWMVGVLDNPTLEDLVTAAALAVISPGEFPSGSCETLNFTNKKSEDVLETRGCLEILAAIMVAGGDTRDGDGGSNDGTGIGGMRSTGLHCLLEYQ